MKVTKVSGELLSKIDESIEKHNLIKISYVDSKNRPSVRTIEPYEIKNGLLYGFCLTKNGTRAFKLTNIQTAEFHSQTFNPRF